MVSTQACTSQAGGSDSDSSVFSFSVTPTTIGYSGNSEWVLETVATYHVCPNRDCFSTFEKLDGCFAIIGDDHQCKVEGIGTLRIKIFDGMVRELKEVRYVPQIKKNFISVGTLKVLGHGVSVRDGVLKITRGSMVVLKDVRRNNLYYLMGSTIIGQVATSISSGDVCT